MGAVTERSRAPPELLDFYSKKKIQIPTDKQMGRGGGGMLLEYHDQYKHIPMTIYN